MASVGEWEQVGGADRGAHLRVVTETSPSAVALAADASDLLERLASADLSEVDADELRLLVGATTSLLAQADAAAAVVSGEVERRGHEREQGFFSTRAFMKHHGKLAGPTALVRTQTMRMFDAIPEWGEAAAAGSVGADQVRLMARVAANPRVVDAVAAEASSILWDARHLPYDEFERRLREFARRVDRDGAAAAAESARERRDARVTCERDGSWTLRATFGSLDGAEFNEVFAHFVEAEFRADLDQARRDGIETDEVAARHDQLARTEPQRRADALLAMARSAASAPAGSKTPLPTLDVLIDEATLRSALTGEPLRPVWGDGTCRTAGGDLVDIDEAAGLALWAHVRRAILDGRGVVIDLGRRKRLFTGSARDAALLMSMTCAWPGCDRPIQRCEADHAVEWQHLGASDPDNAAGTCKGHNLLKTRGRFAARRDTDGTWLFFDAAGRQVG